MTQDECVVLTNYTGRPDHLFMGVFDGHGIVGEGDLAARKAQELLPKVLEGALASGLGTGGIGVACEQVSARSLCRCGVFGLQGWFSVVVPRQCRSTTLIAPFRVLRSHHLNTATSFRLRH